MLKNSFSFKIRLLSQLLREARNGKEINTSLFTFYLYFIQERKKIKKKKKNEGRKN